MRLLPIILLLFIATHSVAQSYTVIHTIGKILDTKSGKYLAKGTKVDQSATLKFETKGARAAVLGSSRGRFVIQETSQAETKSDLVYTLSSVVSPARGRLSTRAGGINNKLDFEKYFQEGSVAILGDSFSVEVSPVAYPMDETKFFYAQYQANGEAINKKLPGENGNLQLSTSDFFSIDGQSIDPEEVTGITLYYYNATTQESSMITDLSFAVVSNEELKSIADQMEGDIEGTLEVINSLYGKCSQGYLESAIKAME